MTSTPTPAYESPRPHEPARWLAWLQSLRAFAGLVLVFLLFTALRPRTFPTLGNLQVMATQTAGTGIAALGMTLIIISGGIDLSVGSAIALVGMVVAWLLKEAHAAPTLAALGGILAGALCGLVVGGLITGLRLVPFIVTLGAWGAYRGIAKGIGHEQPINPPATWLNALLDTPAGDSRWMIFPAGVWMLAALALFVAGLLRYTKFGRHVFAVGSNEQTARLCGVHVERTKLGVYALAGALTGVAGLLQFAYLNQGDPTTAAGKELDVIAAVVIGGASLSGGEGSVLGTLVGALLMTVVNNGCNKLGMSNWTQEIVTGCIIILAAAFDRLQHRRAK